MRDDVVAPDSIALALYTYNAALLAPPPADESCSDYLFR
jgi:hypothetical protein